MNNPLESQSATTGWRSDYQIGLDDGRREQQTRITDLEAQLAAVQADADIYYWLRDRMQVRYEKPISGGKERQTLSMRQGFSFAGSTISPASGWLDLKSFDKCRAKVDETIRAAIAGEET